MPRQTHKAVANNKQSGIIAKQTKSKKFKIFSSLSALARKISSIHFDLSINKIKKSTRGNLWKSNPFSKLCVFVVLIFTINLAGGV